MTENELVEFYQFSIFRKLEPMNQIERATFMTDIFGKKWHEVYEQIANHYPALNNSK